MTPHGESAGTPPRAARQERAWRLLVALQLLVAAAIVAGLLVVAVVGAVGSLFAQRGF